jgi:hypothetical protein
MLFAEAAGWDRPIRIRGGVAATYQSGQIAADARAHERHGIRYADLGRPALHAIDRG